MEEFIASILISLPTAALLLIMAVTLYTLGKGADILVEEAVKLSVHWGIPKIIIGATIISLGTTLPETTVSVLAAINGNPDLALGNAIGSIIVDTSLIIGLAALLGHLPIDQTTIDRQGKIQILSGILLAVVCLPFFSAGKGGNVSQFMGFIFLILLILYIFVSIKWAIKSNSTENDCREEKKPLILQLLKLAAGLFIVVASSKIIIPLVEITAVRLGIAQSIIAATIVAFGTSVPELVTAVTAVKKGHGELAIGNVVGADILNVLFVTGASAAVTRGGLNVPPNFYSLQIPAMVIILIIFRFFTKNGDKRISKTEGLVLLSAYTIYLFLSYI